MKLSEQIRAAAKRLTPETWLRGNFFNFEKEKNTLCMCAHGAMQMECNPAIATMLKKGTFRDFHEAYMEVSISAGASLIAYLRVDRAKSVKGANSFIPGTSLSRKTAESVWGARGNSSPSSYLLGMVGLTTRFNDKHSSFEDVKAKFEEAAKLAEGLGV